MFSRTIAAFGTPVWGERMPTWTSMRSRTFRVCAGEGESSGVIVLV